MRRVLPLVVLLAACEPPAPPPVDPQAERVARIMQVEAGAADRTYEFIGQVEAAQLVDLRFEVGGTLRHLNAREGETLKAGTLVAALDRREFELAVREAEVQRQLAQQDLERKTALLARRVISRAIVDDATALLELRAVHLEQARKNLSETELHAPFDAYVATRFLDNHAVVQAGNAVARLADLTELRISVNIPEALLATIPQSDVTSMTARFAFIEGETFPLTYRENQGEADPVAQTYHVSLSMSPPPRWNILPGMTARVEVRLANDDSVAPPVTVPAGALVTTADGAFAVWVFDHASGSVTPVRVQVQPDGGQGFRVLDGLEGGEWIVAAGAHQVQPGMRIRPLDDTDTGP